MFRQKRKRSRQFKNSSKVIDIEQARAERRARRKQEIEKKQSRRPVFEETSERKSNQKNRKKLIYGGILISIAMIIGASIINVYSLKQEYNDVINEKKILEQKKQALTDELGNVNNPEYVEEQARQQLKMVKPGEIMYILPHTDDEKIIVSTEGSMDLLPAGEVSD